MNRRLTSIGAVLRKDLLSLLPLTAGAATLPMLRPWFHLVHKWDLPEQPLLFFTAFVSGLLAIAVVHNDAAASTRHDWLTRPIRRLDMIVAKGLYLIATIGLPWMIGAFGQAVLTEHLPVGEALFAAAGQLIFVLFVLPLLAGVCLTATFVEAVVSAVVVFLSIFGLLTLAGQLQNGPSSNTIRGDNLEWMAPVAIFVALAGCVLVLWLQFGRRRTLGARLTAFGTIIATGLAGGFAAGMTPPPAAGSPPASITLEGPGACLIAQPSSGRSLDPATNMHQWEEADLDAAGPGAKPLVVMSRVAGLPAGWTVAVDHLALQQGGKAAMPGGRIWTNFGGPGALNATWLATPAQTAALFRPDSRLRLDAAMTVMRPTRTWTLANDGKRHHLPGLGWCGSTEADSGKVVCRYGLPAPALITIRYANQAQQCTVDCGSPMRAPAWIQLPMTQRTGRSLIGRDSRVIVTAYEQAGQVRRSLDIAGPAATCPKPLAPPPADELRRRASFGEHDVNRDGKLDKAEYTKLAIDLGFAGQEDDLFLQRDRNKDGFVSADEYRDPIS